MIESRLKTSTHSRLRFVRATSLAGILLFLIWTSASAGIAGLFAAYAARTGELSAADTATSLSSRDAQPHLVRGGVLQSKGEFSGAVAEYSRAVSLRPDDYVLWLNLAHARELTRDRNGAIAAATEAVKLAPHYAKPHWQLGNLLVRAGRADGGFSELRVAAASNPSLLPAVIDLASGISNGDVQYILTAVDPRTPESYAALAAHFRKHSLTTAAIAMFRPAGNSGEPERRTFLAELLSAKQFQQAHSLWTIAHPIQSDPDGPTVNPLFDPGFEKESDLDEPGFGWRNADKLGNVRLSLDAGAPREGRYSVQVSYQGDSDPAQPAITQLVKVSGATRYRLHFAVRTETLVSGGLPGVTVVDAGSGQVVGQSGSFPQTSGGWRDYTVDFTTPETTEAIQIRLQRGSCASPCPIFGALWLDNFVLQDLRDAGSLSGADGHRIVR